MVLNPRVEPWTQVSDGEHRGIKPIFSSAVAEREGGLKQWYGGKKVGFGSGSSGTSKIALCQMNTYIPLFKWPQQLINILKRHHF